QTTPKVAGGGKVAGFSRLMNHGESPVLPATCPERNPSSMTAGTTNSAQRRKLARSCAGLARRFIGAPANRRRDIGGRAGAAQCGLSAVSPPSGDEKLDVALRPGD